MSMSKNYRPTWCHGKDHLWRPNRREFLFVGMVGGLGLSLGSLLRAEAAPAAKLAGKPAAAKSVIQIFLPGGMSAQESFDPKLYAPIEYRGPLEAIKTK